eukprot:4127258-Pyramimonas_sp.AAC.1
METIVIDEHNSPWAWTCVPLSDESRFWLLPIKSNTNVGCTIGQRRVVIVPDGLVLDPDVLHDLIVAQ